MKEKQVFDPALETIWKFLRGDMEPQNFANWVYAQDNLESRLGETLYFETIATNYSRRKEVFMIKTKLSSYAIPATESGCRCIRLSNMDLVEMGERGNEVFRHFEHIRKHGQPYWWLSIYQCNICKQWWLVAKEDRVNHIFCVRRVDNMEVQRLLNANIWPEDFNKYEFLLNFIQKVPIVITVVDPNNPLLVKTVVDLAKERPGIKISELEDLLVLDRVHVKDIAKKAILQTNDKLNIQGIEI